MPSNTEIPRISAHCHRVGGGIVTDHEAGTGHNPPAMGLNYPPVDPRTLTEIVCVDDKKTSRHGSQPKLVQHKARLFCLPPNIEEPIYNSN
jgi:hypothetical protein